TTLFRSVLALISFSKAATEQLQLKAVYADAIGEQLISDKLQSPEPLEMKVETPVLAFGLNPVDDPLAAPLKLPEFFDGANAASSRIEAPNIGFALTGREVGMIKSLLTIYCVSESPEGDGPA